MGGRASTTDSEDTSARLEKEPRWKTAAPWLGAIAVITYLFSEIPVDEVLVAAGEARLAWFVPGILFAVGFWFLLDSLAFSYLITQFNQPLSWPEARAMRGVTYLLTAINWNVGTAGIIFYLRRFKAIPALESTSSIFFYSVFDLLVLLSFALGGAWSLESTSELGDAGRTTAGLLFFTGASLALLRSDRPDWGWMQRVRAWSVFRSHRLATPQDFAVLLAIRAGYFSCFVAAFYFGAKAFGIDVSLTLAIASTPLILLAGALPITPGGLGTQAAAMLYLWGDTGDQAAILALGLILPIVLTGARVLLGLPYLAEFRRLNRDLA
jgi:uncharacterized membrane protein YbhN (UPF0104 family)